MRGFSPRKAQWKTSPANPKNLQNLTKSVINLNLQNYFDHTPAWVIMGY